MNSFDSILIVIIAVFTVRGIFRGLITELTVLIALIAGYVLAFLYLDNAVGMLQKYFPNLQEFAAKTIAFILIFLIVNIVLRLTAKALNKFASFTFMQSVNKIAGGLFAAAKATLIISIVFLIVEFLPFSKTVKKASGAQESALYQPILEFAPWMYKTITYIFPEKYGIEETFERNLQKVDSTAQQFVPTFK